jgi:hypothetical protein
MTGYCLRYNQAFEVTDDLYTAPNSESTMVECPVCQAHGRRQMHILMDTWKPGWEYRDTKAATEEAAALA